MESCSSHTPNLGSFLFGSGPSEMKIGDSGSRLMMKIEGSHLSLGLQRQLLMCPRYSGSNFSFTEKLTVKYAGAAAMYFVSKKLKKRHNITDERAALYEAAETWVDGLNGREFLGGSKPNLADLAVFGVLRPIRYLRSGRDMVENTRIGEWYTRMENAVGESSRIKA
ncbi:Prostaglandin E synthase 2 [Vitis vinifera]|uniref:Prostaglandin E synthase 2 n=1 Tax=Vitis vinifera TaxID=29760 RepID=A0A438K9B6_VITVI|nr:Prostaglandin E synthase 2 [Vitis vinifera]